MIPSHDSRLVLLSILVSLLAAYAAGVLAERVRDAGRRLWPAWLIGAALVDGLGTWSMHYTAKLALRLPVPLLFDWRLVLASLVVAVMGSAATLVLLARGPVGWDRVLAAGVSLGGLGISGTHYTAMAAVQLPLLQAHQPAMVALAVSLAVGLTTIATSLTHLPVFGLSGRWQFHVCALVRGTANPAMHYTAMAGVVFIGAPASNVLPVADLSHMVSIASIGVVGVSIVPVMVLIVALLTSLVDRLERQRALLHHLFEQAPQAVALLTADHHILRVNAEFVRLFGYPSSETFARPISDLIVPPTLQEEARKHEEAIARGERLDAETTRRRKDGRRLDVSMVMVPVSLPGRQQAVYAIFRDITERKRVEGALRVYSRRLLEVQESERGHLARELHDEIGQVLTSILLMLRSSRQLSAEATHSQVEQVQSVVRDLLKRVQNLALDLRPPEIEDFGLVPALRGLFDRYTRQTAVTVRFEPDGAEGRRLRPEVEMALYRIVQEALTNVARHAGVQEAAVQLHLSPHSVTAVVEDRGRGLDVAAVRAGVGLSGMRERAALLNGRLTIDSAAGSGFRVTATLPLRDA